MTTLTIGHGLRRSLVRGRVRDFLAGSPGRLRRIGAVGLLAAVLIAVGGSGALALMVRSLDRSDAALAHLELIQSARTSLLQADADATDAFLRGGLEPTAQRRQYMSALASAAKDVANAAGSGSSSGSRSGSGSPDSRYADVADGLTHYSGLIETARSTNRQAQPVGANYLRMGSDLLHNDVLPKLATLATADSQRADAGFAAATRAAAGFAACLLIGLIGLVWSQHRLAVLTRSVFTVPAAVTSAVLLAVAVAAVVLVVLSVRHAGVVRDGSSLRTADLVQARASAFEARAAESLTLVGRGSYPQGESTWTQALNSARQRAGRADPDLLTALSAYAAGHTASHSRDDAGDWAGAVKLATAQGGTSEGAAFNRFDAESAGRLAQVTRQTAAGLRSSRAGLTPAAAALGIGGLLAGAGLFLGVAGRLAEYR